MEDSVMKILIIGLGGIGQRHARNLRTLLGQDVELIAYRVRALSHVVTAQLELDRTRSVEEELGIESFRDLAAALRQKPDAAFICNPSSLHIPIALECANAGCDLFLEKPVSNTLDGIDELIETVQSKKLIGMVGFQLRFHPAIRAMATLLKERVVGGPIAVRATVGEYLPNFHRYEDYRSGYAARSDLGGGVLLTQIHEFDYLYSLFGLPSQLFAMGGHWSDLEIDVEDTASILMQCSVDGRQLPVHLHQDYLQNPPSRRCEILTEWGKIEADFPSLSVTVTDRKTGSQTIKSFPNFDRNRMFLDETQQFLDCLRTREQPSITLQDGAQSLRMALAAKQSIATGKLVSIAEI